MNEDGEDDEILSTLILTLVRKRGVITTPPPLPLRFF